MVNEYQKAIATSRQEAADEMKAMQDAIERKAEKEIDARTLDVHRKSSAMTPVTSHPVGTERSTAKSFSLPTQCESTNVHQPTSITCPTCAPASESPRMQPFP